MHSTINISALASAPPGHLRCAPVLRRRLPAKDSAVAGASLDFLAASSAAGATAAPPVTHADLVSRLTDLERLATPIIDGE